MPRKSRAAVKQLEKRGSTQCHDLPCELGEITIFISFVIYLNEKVFKLFYVPCCLQKACRNKTMSLEEVL